MKRIAIFMLMILALVGVVGIVSASGEKPISNNGEANSWFHSSVVSVVEADGHSGKIIFQRDISFRNILFDGGKNINSDESLAIAQFLNFDGGIKQQDAKFIRDNTECVVLIDGTDMETFSSSFKTPVTKTNGRPNYNFKLGYVYKIGELEDFIGLGSHTLRYERYFQNSLVQVITLSFTLV